MQMQTVCVRVCVCARVHAYRDVYESQTHVNMFDIISRQWCALTLCLTKLRTKDNVWWCLRLHQCESVRNVIWSNAWYCIYYIIFKSFTENFWTIQGMLDIEFLSGLCANLDKLKQYQLGGEERSKEFLPLFVGCWITEIHKYMKWFHNATFPFTLFGVWIWTVFSSMIIKDMPF